jgi:hypothetical protein
VKISPYKAGFVWVADGIGEVLSGLFDFDVSLKVSLLEVDIGLQLFGIGFDLWVGASDFYGQAQVGLALYTPIAGFNVDGGVKWTGKLDRLNKADLP